MFADIHVKTKDYSFVLFYYMFIFYVLFAIIKMVIIMDCIFCKIINGDIPSYKVYEDDLVYAFLDINPMSAGHTLIIPKKHYLDLSEIDNVTLTRIIDTARLLRKRLEDKLNIDGLTLIQNNGDVQEVKHFHLHLKPYYKNEVNLSVEEVYNLIKED